MIYLPSSSKNLISISQWSNDKGDDCGVISRGEYSLFMWDHDSKQKFIPHNPECKIPLMPVNEGDSKFTSFLSTIDNKLMDKVCLLQDGVVQCYDVTAQARDPDKQSGDLDQQLIQHNVQQGDNQLITYETTPSIVPVGSIVRINDGLTTNLSIVIKDFVNESGITIYEVRTLNGKDTQMVEAHHMSIISPDPSFVPTEPSDIDPNEMAKYLTKLDLAQLWNGNIDDTVQEAARVTLYWHHRLRHMPLVALHRLAKRGVLPKCILKVKKDAFMCSMCLCYCP